MRNDVMKENNFLHALVINFKSIKLLFTKYPKVFLAYGVNSLFNTLTPYVYLYLCARLINELVIFNMAMIWKMVVLTLIVNVVFGMLGIILNHTETYYNSVFMLDKETIFTNKLLSLKYKDLDSSSTYDLLAQIHMNEQYAGYGLTKSVDILKKMISIIASIGGALILCFSLFTSKVTNDKYQYLNNSFFSIAIIVAMFIVSILSPMISNKAKAYWASKVGQATLTNRLYSFYGFLAYDQSRSLDIRLYNQNAMCEKGYHEFNAFKPGGEVANCAKGYMGIGLSLSVALSYIITWLVYVYVCMKAWAGAFEIGFTAQYLGALISMSSGVSGLLAVYGDIKTNAIFLETTFKFLELPENIVGGKILEANAVEDYRIEFKKVYFKYPNASEWAVNDISCIIEKGKHIAIVGENGSGKTTFVKLLCRLYEPDKGEILLNGVNIKEYSFESYIKTISAVFQDYSLISQPIKNNVSVSKNVDFLKAWKSVEMVDVKEYIDGLPNKMDTFLFKDYAEDGVNLSGGEEQKIAIARAIYKDSPLVILDEPTAALDPISESNIYANLSKIESSKTMIFISHRLSSCVFCNTIFVFEQGQIVQSGKHSILVSTPGKYQELWNAQAKYYE